MNFKFDIYWQSTLECQFFANDKDYCIVKLYVLLDPLLPEILPNKVVEINQLQIDYVITLHPLSNFPDLGEWHWRMAIRRHVIILRARSTREIIIYRCSLCKCCNILTKLEILFFTKAYSIFHYTSPFSFVFQSKYVVGCSCHYSWAVSLDNRCTHVFAGWGWSYFYLLSKCLPICIFYCGFT